MYPISSDLLARFQGEQPQFCRITIGSTNPLIIYENRVKQGGLSVNRFCGTGVGNTASAEATVVLDNHDGEYNDFAFVGKEMKIEVGVKDANDVTQYIPLGYFEIDESPRKLSQIRITALDRMMFFERPIDWTQLSFPCTVASLLTTICNICGVTISQYSLSSLTNASYNITETPSVAETYRDLLGYICQISGNNAYFANGGALVVTWFSRANDGFTFTESNRRDADTSEDAVAITGVVIETATQKFVSGSDAYPITISQNPLITHDEQSVANTLKNKFNNFVTKPFSCTILPNPVINTMDGYDFVDKNGNTFHVNITDYTFTMNCWTAVRGKGDSTVTKSYAVASTKDKGVPLDEAIEILKANIIRTAEVLNQDMQTLEQTLTGQIQAVSSEFGEYKQESSQKIEANANGVTQTFTEIQNINTNVTNIDASKVGNEDFDDLSEAVGLNTNFRSETTSKIHTGVLWYEGSTPIVGIAISQGFTYQTVNGQKTIVRQGFYSTYTANELAFYIGTTKVAYVSNNQLYITEANVLDKIRIGRYVIDDEVGKGLTIRYVG